MDRAAPWRLPGFVIEELIGAGSSGQVWRARVRATGVAVALKRVPLDDAAARQAALSEAALLSALHHPHLVRLHDVVPVESAIVLVLDLADGGALDRLLAARGRLTPGETVTAIAPIAAALAHAHLAGVVHGDVSAANVLFTGSGLPLLADLGVSRLLGDRAPARSTPAYIDPLMALGHLPGPSSDVFMIAAVALHALTGHPLWPGADAAAALAAASAEAELDIAGRLAAAGVSPRMAAVLERALTLAPEHRGTAAEFALDLRHSEHPIAVELGAGGPARAAAIAPARPPFDRPERSQPVGSPAFTHGARPPAPFPPGGAQHRRAGPSTRSRRWLAALGGVAAAMVVIGMLATRSAGRHAGAASTGRHAGAALAGQPAASGSTANQPAASGSTGRIGRPPPSSRRAVDGPAPTTHARPSDLAPARLPAVGVRRVLDGLDAHRAAAYARRDPRELRRVYVPGPLLVRDAAALSSIVPPGCGLVGARTAYSHVRILARRGASVTVRARAQLAASNLVCQSRPAGHAGGDGPVTLIVELAHTSAGYRIAAQHES
jgi:hypothetical protein